LAKRIGDKAEDTIYLVVTVNKQSTAIRLLQPKRIMPTGPTLAPNEYAFKLTIKTNFKDWEDRTTNYVLPEVKPPLKPTLGLASHIIGESIEDKVTRKLTQ
jgi:hypothetical protein